MDIGYCFQMFGFTTAGFRLPGDVADTVELHIYSSELSVWV